MAKGSKLVVAVSDIHCGSATAMVPPEGVRLDDGGTYQPSKANSWLWDCWEEFWTYVGLRKVEAKAALYIVYNGDLFDGDHHRTTQLVSANPETQDYLADRIYGVPRELKPKAEFVVRGTEVHVGASGAMEESFARRRRAEKDPDAETHSWWHLRCELNGVLLDAQHHGRIGTRPWTKTNAVSAAALEIFYEHSKLGRRPPDIALRSHRHQYGDSYDVHPVRVIQTPAWQLKTAYAHKVAANSSEDIGGMLIEIDGDGRYEVEKRLYVREEAAVWRP